ncbi:hypothetical protein WDW86_18965 [Bdellovibrionota bacterium FG-2]
MSLSNTLRLPYLGCTVAEIFSGHGLSVELYSCSAPPLSTQKKTGETRGRSTEKIDLLADLKIISIPDGSKAKAGNWVKLPYCLALKPSQCLGKVILRLKIDHFFPDDLQIGWADTKGNLHEFFKGEEEVPIPPSLVVPNAPTCGSIIFRDLQEKYTGAVIRAELEFSLTAPTF